MKTLIPFLLTLLGCTPIVIAIVNALAEDVAMPRWLRRTIAVVFGEVVALGAAMLFGLDDPASVPPLAVCLIGGLALGLQAAGVYDFGKLVGRKL